MSEICCVLQGMMGGYPPGLPPLQGPVDGLVSMGSMQPLHPGGPPPHHLPPGVPGLPGIPPQGKNFILIHSLISPSCSFLLPQPVVLGGNCCQLWLGFPHWESQSYQQQGLSCTLSKWPSTCVLTMAATQDTWQRPDSADQERGKRHTI